MLFDEGQDFLGIVIRPWALRLGIPEVGFCFVENDKAQRPKDSGILDPPDDAIVSRNRFLITCETEYRGKPVKVCNSPLEGQISQKYLPPNTAILRSLQCGKKFNNMVCRRVFRLDCAIHEEIYLSPLEWHFQAFSIESDCG